MCLFDFWCRYCWRLRIIFFERIGYLMRDVHYLGSCVWYLSYVCYNFIILVEYIWLFEWYLNERMIKNMSYDIQCTRMQHSLEKHNLENTYIQLKFSNGSKKYIDFMGLFLWGDRRKDTPRFPENWPFKERSLRLCLLQNKGHWG